MAPERESGKVARAAPLIHSAQRIENRRSLDLQNFCPISPNFLGLSENPSDLYWSDVNMIIFQRNLRDFAKLIRQIVAELLNMCPKR